MKGTIKSTTEISSLFAKAKRYNTNNLVVLIGERNDRRGLDGRVAYIAGKRLGPAPLRNRAKRRLRAAVMAVGVVHWGYDLVFVASKATVFADFQAIVNDIRKLGRRFESNGS